MNPRILLVHEEPATAWAISRALRHDEVDIIPATCALEAGICLRQQSVDVVIADQRLREESGQPFMDWLANNHPEPVRIMVSGQNDLQGVVQAFNKGQIYKFIVRPWANDTLRLIVRDAINKAREGSIDARSGWLTYKAFCTALTLTLNTRKVRVIAAEIRNATTIWSLLDGDLRRQLADKVADRTRAIAGELVVPLASLERGLFAFALDGEFSDQNLDGLFDRLRAPFTLLQNAVTLQLDFGITETHPQDTDGATVLRRAMQALTALPQGDIRRVGIWREDSSQELHQLHSLERDLVRAMAKNEFFVQIQPQVSSRDFRIAGGETLIRWRHPEHGLVSPLQFIDMAERNGFINEIGLWITNKAVQTLEILDAEGADHLRLSFNVSPRQFLGAQTAGWAMLLRDYAMDNPELMHRLEIEITESTIIHDQSLAQHLLTEFKDMGLRIALDDFGTGYSSLSQIMELPLDVLKLDRSLIQDIENNQRSRLMVKHLANMAHDLGLEIVAEGVETAPQIELCRELGCDLIQGFAFHRPLDPACFLAAVHADSRH
jgi:EAL domain-containing protein (putative c-di-GMP-specific phosphodiesterase class I)/DNA-binding response OmpR family regulator